MQGLIEVERWERISKKPLYERRTKAGLPRQAMATDGQLIVCGLQEVWYGRP